MGITAEVLNRMKERRPVWPTRAIVTSGMPYGNKSLHCGHITLFIHSDFFARFLRDRIGEKNVIYVSGTDCYGSQRIQNDHHDNPGVRGNMEQLPRCCMLATCPLDLNHQGHLRNCVVPSLSL